MIAVVATPSVPFTRMFHIAPEARRRTATRRAPRPARPARPPAGAVRTARNGHLDHQPAEDEGERDAARAASARRGSARTARTPRTPHGASRTIARTKSTVAASLHCGASRWSGESAGKVEVVVAAHVAAAAAGERSAPSVSTPYPTANVSVTPMMPGQALARALSSCTPSTPYPARGLPSSAWS